MCLLKNKKSMAGLSNLGTIIIAIIAGIAILAVIATIFGTFSDPDKIEEGMKCRIAIKLSNTIEEFSAGMFEKQFIDSCHLIQKKLPLRDKYPTLGIKSSRQMSEQQTREAIMFDFAELINNAWWISGEGDSADTLLEKLESIFASKNDCYVFYAVRISTREDFNPISEADLFLRLEKITRSDIKGSALKGDTRSVMEYTSVDGKGAGVFMKTIEKSEDPNDKIQRKIEGADAIYGIAVGFAKKSGVNKLWNIVIKDERHDFIKEGESFIYIAPYDKVANLCVVI